MADWESPWYVAVIDKVPTGNFLVVSVATPPLRVADPIDFAPFMNFTLPVGRIGPGEDTVAVSVTV